jgi:hypothetical protein
MVKELKDYLKVEIKDYKKYNKKIICLTYLQESLDSCDELFYPFIEEYKKSMLSNKDSFLFIDARNIKYINMYDILERAEEIQKLNPIVIECLIGIVYFINNPVFKVMGNKIMEMHKPPIPAKICDQNSEALVFCKKIFDETNKRN